MNCLICKTVSLSTVPPQDTRTANFIIHWLCFVLCLVQIWILLNWAILQILPGWMGAVAGQPFSGPSSHVWLGCLMGPGNTHKGVTLHWCLGCLQKVIVLLEGGSLDYVLIWSVQLSLSSEQCPHPSVPVPAAETPPRDDVATSLLHCGIRQVMRGAGVPPDMTTSFRCSQIGSGRS